MSETPALTFAPKNTKDYSEPKRKTLIYAFHGWGKTHQMKLMQQTYGPGFILSGESGLSSIQEAGIDYLPFTSWSGVTDPSRDLYSFRSIAAMMVTPEFRAKKYAWVGLDSLSELSDLIMQHAQLEAEQRAERTKKGVNGFEVYSEYNATVLRAVRFVRDLPYHVIASCLAVEKEDDNGVTGFWPLLGSKDAMKKVPGMFDCVFCGTRSSTGSTSETYEVKRRIITEEIGGWHGKVRDEFHVIKPIEEVDDITVLFGRMDTAARSARAKAAARKSLEEASAAKAAYAAPAPTIEAAAEMTAPQ